jgi:hypothetical protein
MKTVTMGSPEPKRARWPEHLPVGALRVVRWSARYDQTVVFYRDVIGLPVLEIFHGSTMRGAVPKTVSATPQSMKPAAR